MREVAVALAHLDYQELAAAVPAVLVVGAKVQSLLVIP
jgi:hypothetical protein